MTRSLTFIEGREPARIVRQQPEFGGTVVVRGAQPAVHRAADVPGLLLRIAPRIVPLGDAQPFDVPALVVARLHAARGLEAFAYRAAALLRLAERAAELVRHEEVLRPVVPAERLRRRGGAR